MLPSSSSAARLAMSLIESSLSISTELRTRGLIAAVSVSVER